MMDVIFGYPVVYKDELLPLKEFAIVLCDLDEYILHLILDALTANQLVVKFVDTEVGFALYYDGIGYPIAFIKPTVVV